MRGRRTDKHGRARERTVRLTKSRRDFDREKRRIAKEKAIKDKKRWQDRERRRIVRGKKKLSHCNMVELKSSPTAQPATGRCKLCGMTFDLIFTLMRSQAHNITKQFHDGLIPKKKDC